MSLSQDDVLKSVEDKVGFDVWDNETYKDNLIKLEVYFEEFNFEKISETPSYTVSNIAHLILMWSYSAAPPRIFIFDCGNDQNLKISTHLPPPPTAPRIFICGGITQGAWGIEVPQ